jgi:hypothetical protein
LIDRPAKESRSGKRCQQFLPAADLVTIVRGAKTSQLFHIAPDGIALTSTQAIVVKHVLNGSDRVVEIPFIESAIAPSLGEFPQFVLGMIQAPPLSAREVPHTVAPVQIHMNLIDKG